MIYFDTSFLVPLVLPETTSSRVAAFVRQIDLEQLSVSHWTRVEFSSLIAREVRMGGLDARAAAQADARFETMVEVSFTILLPTASISALPSSISASSRLDCELGTPCIWQSPATMAPT